MNYCSLEDAWGNSNRMCSQYTNYMDEKKNNNNNNNNTLSPSCAMNDYNSKPESLIKQNVEKYTDISYKTPYTYQNKILQNTPRQYDDHIDELNNCDDFIKHIRSCKRCHNKIKYYFKPKIVENIQNIIEDNKDTIVLILIGISILLFFNLIHNMTKSN